MLVGSTGPTLNGTTVNRLARLVGLPGSPYPDLTSIQNGTSMVMTWPNYAANWRLQETSNLGVPFVDSVPPTGTTSNGITTVSIPLQSGQRFSRLERLLP